MGARVFQGGFSGKRRIRQPNIGRFQSKKQLFSGRILFHFISLFLVFLYLTIIVRAFPIRVKICSVEQVVDDIESEEDIVSAYDDVFVGVLHVVPMAEG